MSLWRTFGQLCAREPPKKHCCKIRRFCVHVEKLVSISSETQTSAFFFFLRCNFFFRLSNLFSNYFAKKNIWLYKISLMASGGLRFRELLLQKSMCPECKNRFPSFGEGKKLCANIHHTYLFFSFPYKSYISNKLQHFKTKKTMHEQLSRSAVEVVYNKFIIIIWNLDPVRLDDSFLFQ